LAAQLIGEWVPGPSTVQNTNISIMQLPDIAAVLANLSRILAPFPEARAALVAYLRDASPAPPKMIEHQQ
jgi:hypothetical protein